MYTTSQPGLAPPGKHPLQTRLRREEHVLQDAQGLFEPPRRGEDDLLSLSVWKGCSTTTRFQGSDNQSEHCKTMKGQHIFFRSVCRSQPSTAVLLKTAHWRLSRLTKLTVKILCYGKANNLLATRRQGKDSVNSKKLLSFKKKHRHQTH